MKAKQQEQVPYTAQVQYLARQYMPILTAICEGFACDPGHSDLDDEQPIHVEMTLGDYRRACRLKYELQGVAK